MDEDFAALLSGRSESLCTMRILFKSSALAGVFFSRTNQTYCAINNIYHSSEPLFPTAQANMLVNYELN